MGRDEQVQQTGCQRGIHPLLHQPIPNPHVQVADHSLILEMGATLNRGVLNGFFACYKPYNCNCTIRPYRALLMDDSAKNAIRVFLP